MKLTEGKAEKIGLALVELLYLKVTDDRIDTSYGTKSVVGLALTVDRIITEIIEEEE